MKIFSFFLFFASLISAPSSKAVVGGQAVNGANYPYVVMLSYDGYFKECSGVVLEPRRVLTSVSCLFHLNNQIPVNSIYVHPNINGNIGPFTFLPLDPTDTPSIQVSSYAIHPQNPFSGGPYNLAILKLSANISAAPAYIYNGTQQFIGQNGTALGWEFVELPPNPVIQGQYELRKLIFPLVLSTTDIDSICYDSLTLTGTVYCGGFRNAVKFLEYPQDEGGPMIRPVNNKEVIIGLLRDASNGQPFEGVHKYEEYARVAAMISFIKQNAPNTRFWNETSVIPQPDKPNIVPFLQLLLLNE